MSEKDIHTGSTFEDFIREEDSLEEVDAVAVERVDAWQQRMTASDSSPKSEA